MTTTVTLQASAPAHTTNGASTRSARELAHELLAEHARLGARVAALDPDDGATWETVGPTLAALSAVGRHTAREVGGIRARGQALEIGPALTEADAAPPVARAREIAVMQRLVRYALRDIERDTDTGPQCAAAPRDALRQTRTVRTGLATAGDQHGAAFGASFLGRAHLLRGDLDDARRWLEQALLTAQAEAWVAFVPWPEALLADAELRGGHLDQAAASFQHALALGEQPHASHARPLHTAP